MNNTRLLSLPLSLARLTIGQWLLVIVLLALVSWGQAFHHNLSQVGMLAGGVALYFAARRLGTEERANLLVLCGAVAVVAVVALTAANGGQRLPAEPVNPNALAAVLLLTLPAAPGLWGGFLGLLALLLTQSRAALLPAALWVGVRLAAATGAKTVRWLGLAGLVALAVGLVASRPATVEARLRVWAEAVRLIERNPVWGVGFGNYAHYARTEPRKLHADSLPLTLLAEMGLVGGGAALVAVGGIALRVATSHRPPLRWGLGLWLMQQAVDHTATQWFVLAVLMLALADVET